MKRLLLFLLLVLVSLPISAQYLTEDFESAWSGTPPAPTSWSQTRIRAINSTTAEKDWLQNTWTGSAWTITSSASPNPSGAYSGTGVAWIDDYNYMGSSSPQASSRLESPVVNLSSSTSPYLRFWYFNGQGVGVTLNLRVMVSSNGGTTWDVLTPIVNGFTVTNLSWNRISVAIPAPYRTANFKFAFEITNRWGSSNPFIDAVTVEEFTPTTITSAATGDWNTGATWVGGVVPTADNNVVIAAGHTVTMPTTLGIIGRCQNLTIDATGVLNYSTGTANLIHAYGNIIVNGTLNAYNGTSGRFVYCGSDFTINSGGTANFSVGTTSQSTLTTAISTGAAGIAFLNNQSASFTNGGTLTSNYIQNILHLGKGNFTYNNAVICYRTFGLYLGSVNPNGNLTLGNAPSSVTQIVERANGTFSSNPIWNNTNITSRSNSYWSPNWVPITQTTLLTGNEIEDISGTRTVSGTLTMSTHNNLQLNYPLTVGTSTTGGMSLTRGIILTDNTNILRLSSFIAGPTGTAPSVLTPPTTHGSYVAGPMRIDFPATGLTGRNFALGVGTGFNGSTPNSNALRTFSVAVTTAWNSQTIKASITGAPSGTVNSPLTNLFGVRAYRLDLLGGNDLPADAFVTVRGRNTTFGNSDNMIGDISELRVGQSTALTGAWTERSTTSGSGAFANDLDYSRSTAAAAPGPIAPLATYGEYFTLATTTTILNPSGVSATAISNSQINIAFTPNPSNNNVVIVWNSTGTFTAPSGPPTVGSPLAGGTVLFVNTTPSPFNHTPLSAGTAYYYKVFSYDGTQYSAGVPVNATTFSLVPPPYSEGFTTTSTPTGWNITGWTIGSTRGVTGNPGNNIYKNLWSSATTGTFTLIDVGPVTAGTFLSFDYITANYSSPYSPPAAGSGNFVVSVSTNWGTSYTDLETVVNDGVAGWRSKLYNLSAYAGSNVKVRIIGNWVSGDYDLAFDNFKIETPANMIYVSSTTTQNTSDVGVNQTNQQVIGIQVVTTGNLSPLSLTNFNLNTNGTTNAAVDITNAKVFYTGTSNTFAAINPFGSTVASPSGAFTISGSQTLAEGTNYFWLTYDIPSGATAGNLVDAECNQVTIGSNKVPTVQAPAGARTIRGPLNGSYNVGLTPFNEKSGKNITIEKRTRKVEKWIYEDNKSEKITRDVTSDFASQNLSVFENVKPVRSEMVDEDYFVLVENGIPYTGLQSFKYTEEVVTETGSQFIETETFATLTAAIAALNMRGVSGPVTFLLKDATYSASETFPITINPAAGTSSTNTVTIKPAASVNAAITGSNAVTILKLFGVDYLIIDGLNSGGSSLTIENTNTGGSGVIWIGSFSSSDGATNNTIKNCTIKGAGSAGAQTIGGILIGSGTTVGGPSESPNSNLTIQGNTFLKTQNGIYFQGNATTYDDNILISSNIFGSTLAADKHSYRGMLVGNIQNSTVTQNTIAGVLSSTATSATMTGIQLAFGLTNVSVTRNKISDIKHVSTTGWGSNGIYGSMTLPGSNVLIANNFIYDVASYGYLGGGVGDNGYGIIVAGGTGYKIYHNSVNLNSDQTVSGYPAAFNVTSGVTTAGAVDVRNNLFINSQTQTGERYSVYSGAANTVYSNINFNDYYTTGANLGFLGVNQANLAAWRTATGKDAYSVSQPITFAGLTDLHLSGGSIGDGNLASASVAVTNDYDGDTRNAYWPYMGADEVVASPLAIKLTLKVLIEGFWKNSTQDSITVSLGHPTLYTKSAPSKKNLSSTAGVDFYLPKGTQSSYYVIVNQRNSLETWSANTITFPSGISSYDFTDAQNKAYGDNQKLWNSKWCIINGDVSRDDFIDGSDYLGIVNNWEADDTDMQLAGDTNGDQFIDGSDYLQIVNNWEVGAVTPLTLKKLAKPKQLEVKSVKQANE